MMFAILLPRIWDTIHFTSSGYGILCSIRLLLFWDIRYLEKRLLADRGIFAGLYGLLACLLQWIWDIGTPSPPLCKK